MTIYAPCRFSDRPAACSATIRSAIQAIPPAQFIREHHQNAVDACRRRPGVKRHQIAWDVIADLSGEAGLSDEFSWGPKLSVVDTGCGMSPQQMYQHLRTIFESGSEQSIDGNFGWGGRISGIAHSPFGVVYQSWVNGVGYMSQIELDEAGNSGLAMLDEADVFCEWAACVVPIDDEYMPAEVRRNGGFGTRVIFLGKSPGDNTMLPPPFAGSTTHWIAREINTRYMDPPEGIEIRARCGWSEGRINRETILGERPVLEHFGKMHGRVRVSGADVLYWVVDTSGGKKSHTSRHRLGQTIGIAASGEIYDVKDGQSAEPRLRSFGFYAGHSRLVVYVVPDNAKPNLQRTSVTIDGMPPPWESWSDEFRVKMPEELAAWMQDIASKSKKNSEEIRKWTHDRIQSSGLILGAASRLRLHASGAEQSEESAGLTGGARGASGADGGSRHKPNPLATPSSNKPKPIVKPRAQSRAGDASRRNDGTDIPDVRWCDTKDLVAEFSMAGRTITFDRSNNMVIVNLLDPLFQIVVEKLCEDRDYRGSEEFAVRKAAEEAIRRHMGAHICGTIVQILGMASSWDVDRVNRALSDDALLASVAFVNGLMPAMRQDVAKAFAAKREAS